MTAENLLMRKTRWLTQALILSGTLNIGLLATFAYVTLSEKNASLPLELKANLKLNRAADPTNADLLKAYSLLPYSELLLRLENKEPVEEGLTRRDLSLSCLVALHHFNLEKAIGTLPQKRTLLFSHEGAQEKIQLPVYPALSDDQFQAVLYYAKTEKWPLNSQGLFYELQRTPNPKDPLLIDAFCLTSEFETLQALFLKTGAMLPKPLLIDLLCEGDWQTLSTFSSEQRQALDLSIDARRALLFTYLDKHSKTAAELLLQTDAEFLLKRSNDGQILTLLDLCDTNSSQLDSFAKTLLVSPRSDAVLNRARLITKETAPAEQPQKKKLYTIETGDSLWKISRKFHVSIDSLIQANSLETEKLRPGKQLIIPD
jgi:LysM repeat protein